MPIYEFTCVDCENPFETLIRKEEELDHLACPSCSSTKVQRQFSIPAKPLQTASLPTTCSSDGPPCGAPWCGRKG